jgi:Ca2+-binding EF-hand superfamily protein
MFDGAWRERRAEGSIVNQWRGVSSLDSLTFDAFEIEATGLSPGPVGPYITHEPKELFMRPITYFIAALSLGLTFGLAAEAQARGSKTFKPANGQQASQQNDGNRGKRGRPSFEQLDKNGDGKIVAGEVPDRLWQRISRADANNDNAVTKAELDAAKASRGQRGERGKNGRRGKQVFEQLDKNGDGKIVAGEVPDRLWQRISRADADNDNAVTKAELEAARAKRRGNGRK